MSEGPKGHCPRVHVSVNDGRASQKTQQSSIALPLVSVENARDIVSASVGIGSQYMGFGYHERCKTHG